MEPFVKVSGIAAPIDQADINTDMLIPVRFLRKPLSAGYRNYLFFNQRFNPDGTPKPDFILNQDPYSRAKVLVTGANFGCGSTREGAIYALLDFGVRATIASRFGPFQMTNSYQNGLLPVVLAEDAVRRLSLQLHASPGAEITIDLPQQTVTGPDGETYKFNIEPSRKEQLLSGLDEIGITNAYAAEIAAFEQRMDAESPWLIGDALAPLVQK
jgi:3-isopropylmalate/(R)-2-methylmalate dehydratase small subunit